MYVIFVQQTVATVVQMRSKGVEGNCRFYVPVGRVSKAVREGVLVVVLDLHLIINTFIKIDKIYKLAI